jgi:Tfp pilus assembly protein PilF
MVAMKRITLMFVVALSACTSSPTRTLPPVVEEGVSDTPDTEMPQRVEKVAPPVSSSGAVVALLDRADAYQRSGDVGSEAATIERALRIDPNNARLWSRLAATRLQQDQPQQAEQLALKSNALSVGDTALQRQNWRLVARARWAMNDSAGARAAEKKARELEQRY